MILFRLLFFFSLFLYSSLSLAQQPSWYNYTTNNGLLSNEVYKVIEDSQGFLWFATNQGLCRFNGYDFTRPIDTSAQRSSAAFIPTEDPEGNIWFARLDGTLWIVQNDTVSAWKYNPIIDLYKGQFMLVEEMAIEENGTVWLALRGLGFLSVDLKGNHKLEPNLDKSGIISTTIGNKIIYTILNAKSRYGKAALPKIENDPFKLFNWEDGQVVYLTEVSRKSYGNHQMTASAWHLRNGDSFYATGVSLLLFRNNKMIWETEKKIEVPTMLETGEGNILLASQSGVERGLLQYESIEHVQQGEYSNLLPDKFVTYVIVDNQGGYWACTLNEGVFYCKNPALEIFDESSGLPSEDVVCLSNDGNQSIFVGLRPSDICTINSLDGTCKPILRPPISSYEVWDLHFDPLQEKLWCSNPIYYLNNKQWSSIPFADESLSDRILVSAKKITPSPSGNTLWMSAPFGFFNINLEANTAQWYIENKMVQDRTYAVEEDQEGNIWVATINGLQLWKNEQYELPPFDHPALRFPTADLAILPEGGMIISLRGAGLLLRDSGGQFTQITEEDGLTSDYLPNLFVSPDGIIFACSNTGLNKVSPKNNGTWHIETITTKQGLPSNQVNDVTLLQEELWVATDHGLAHFRKILNPVAMPVPVLESFSVNNQFISYEENLSLAYNQNNISIQFFALHFRSGGDILYRYRLLGADTAYINSKSRQINFAKLQPGIYAFEVQAQNENGKWSESANWPFTISPAWWQSPWFMLLLFVMIIGTLWIFYRNRLKRIRKENKVQEKIRELESAALRAQMNPHFIFNCLSSIQQFIIENDAAEATRYLTRFARLVRLTLHGSVDGQHSLREEVDMLDNYLTLEQLRFKGKFIYTIKTAPSLEQDELFFPPMLVQPFVENALLHGMKNKAKGGEVNITFEKKDKQIKVSVIDNGSGISSNKESISKMGHKSIGITLTQHRLEVLSGKRKIETFSHKNLFNARREIIGSEVILYIPFS